MDQHYSIVQDPSSGKEFCQCNLCSYNFDLSFPRGKRSVRGYFNNSHYKYNHGSGRLSHSRPNKRRKDVAVEEVVEEVVEAVNDDVAVDNDFEVGYDFDDCHAKGAMDDIDCGAIVLMDARMMMEDPTEFDQDNISVPSLLSRKSIGSSSSSSLGDTDSSTSEELEEWETLGADNQFDIVYDIVDHDECNLSYGFHEFDIYNSVKGNEDTSTNRCCINQRYFYMKQLYKSQNEGDNRGGYMGLTQMALSKNRNLTDFAPEFETQLIFDINKVLMNSSRNGSVDVMSLVERLCSKIPDNEIDRIPKSYAEARQVVLDGACSTMVNFPCPRVFDVDGHACVSLKECIQIMAGHHGDFEFAWDAQDQKANKIGGLNGTNASCAAVAEVKLALDAAFRQNGNNGMTIKNTSIGWVYLWSDSYLNSFIKQKDNSVWILTATISPPAKDLSGSKFTVVLAIGKSSRDHTKVIEHFYKEISELKKGFKCYSSRHNKLINVAFGLLYHSADRPERHSLANTLDEGTYGLVSNYASVVCPQRLPACQKCYRYLVEKTMHNNNGDRPSCESCLCWTIEDLGDDRGEIYPVPKNYPRHTVLSARTDDDGNVYPAPDPPRGREPGMEKFGNKRLSTAWLIQACEYAYEAVRQKKWTHKELHEYLRSCSINEARRDIVAFIADFDHARGKWRDIKADLPQVWYLFDIFERNLLPDMPMHLLAHGVSDDVIHLFAEILKHFKLHGKFARFANTYISDMASWNLSWLKLKTYPKANWVGENTMAYMRIQSYLYGLFLVNHGPKGKDPVEVQAASEENRSGGTTPRTVDEVRGLVNSMRRMTNALQAMISRIMSRMNQDPYEVLDHIKLFMSTYHHCDTLYVPSSSDEPIGKDKRNLRVVDQLNADEIHQLLVQFQLKPDASLGNKSTLDRVKTGILQERLRSLGLSDKGLKSDLQCRLFGAILKRDLVNNTKKIGILDVLTNEETEKILDELQLPVMVTLDKIKVKFLRSALEERSLPTEGLKEDLQIRLFCHITGRDFNPTETPAPQSTSNDAPDSTTVQTNSPGKGKKKYAWCKGGLLSLLANYVPQFEMYGQCHNIWEARDEANIQMTKKVTNRMRKSQSYLQSILRRLHRVMGFSTLRLDFSDKEQTVKDWFRGYFIFPSQNDVSRRFTAGKPLSCFTLDGRPDCVFVAVKTHNRDTISCLPINYEPARVAKIEAGIHFCQFQCEKEMIEIRKEEILHYAIMLPYIREDGERNPLFLHQWTLIYHDWDVLRIDLKKESYKGCASILNDDFNDLLNELI